MLQAKASCDLSEYDNIPLGNQYFSSAKTGGPDGLADYCPYPLIPLSSPISPLLSSLPLTLFFLSPLFFSMTNKQILPRRHDGVVLRRVERGHPQFDRQRRDVLRGLPLLLELARARLSFWGFAAARLLPHRVRGSD